MFIRKILNNNVVVTENSAGREVVAMRRGIAFKTSSPANQCEGAYRDLSSLQRGHRALRRESADVQVRGVYPYFAKQYYRSLGLDTSFMDNEDDSFYWYKKVIASNGADF